MKKFASLLAAAGLVLSGASAFAGEFGDHCAWGLANGKKVKTDCSVNMKGPEGKVYCFSSEDAKASFAKDAPGNLAKAMKNAGM